MFGHFVFLKLKTVFYLIICDVFFAHVSNLCKPTQCLLIINVMFEVITSDKIVQLSPSHSFNFRQISLLHPEAEPPKSGWAGVLGTWGTRRAGGEQEGRTVLMLKKSLNLSTFSSIKIVNFYNFSHVH